jgi:hypothetical protein
LNSSRNIRTIKAKMIRWIGHVEFTQENRNAYSVLIGLLEGKRPLGRY